MISYWGVDHNDEVSKALMPMSGAKVKAIGRLGRMKTKSAVGGMKMPSKRTMGIAGGGMAAGGAGGYALGRRD